MIAQQLNTLRERLTPPLPGLEAQARMMPSTRTTLYKDFVVPSDARKSAVMILFYPEANSLCFPLIERTAYPGVHSKQISFPGGSVDPEDHDYTATALRETEEEVGVPRQQIEVLGHLSALYIPPSNFWVQPVLGFVPEQPVWIKNPTEVESVIQAPLDLLLSGQLHGESKILHSSGLKMTVPSFTIQGHVVWGATAMMLSELLSLFEAPSSPS